MSINKPGALPTQAVTPTVDQHPAGSQPTPPAVGASPSLQTHQPVPDVGWQQLPDDVLTSLMNVLMAEVESPVLTSADRIAALSTLVSVGNASHREHKVLEHFLKHFHAQMPVDRLWQHMAEVSRPRWNSVADNLKTRREQLIEDFSMTRQLITSAVKANSPIALPEDCDGVAFCFREISVSPSIKNLIPDLAGKTVKLDANEIGADRFASEILPLIEQMPGDCHLVIDAVNNKLNPAHVEELVRLMAQKCNIYRLDLSGNQVGAGTEGAACMAKLFTYSGPLTHLYLANTGMTGATFIELKKNFPASDGRIEHTMLEQLDLRNNQFDADGVLEVTRTLLPPAGAPGLMCADLSLLRLARNPFFVMPTISEEFLRAEDVHTALKSPEGESVIDWQGDPTGQRGFVIGGKDSSSTLDIEFPGEIANMAEEIRADLIEGLAKESRL